MANVHYTTAYHIIINMIVRMCNSSMIFAFALTFVAGASRADSEAGERCRSACVVSATETRVPVGRFVHRSDGARVGSRGKLCATAATAAWPSRLAFVGALSLSDMPCAFQVIPIAHSHSRQSLVTHIASIVRAVISLTHRHSVPVVGTQLSTHIRTRFIAVLS